MQNLVDDVSLRPTAAGSTWKDAVVLSAPFRQRSIERKVYIVFSVADILVCINFGIKYSKTPDSISTEIVRV